LKNAYFGTSAASIPKKSYIRHWLAVLLLLLLL